MAHFIGRRRRCARARDRTAIETSGMLLNIPESQIVDMEM